jgi:uracil-DNA glycosylase family 4
VKGLISDDYGGKYELVRPVVFNEGLDDYGAKDEIKLILVGDNPGRREQETGRYLIGPSGKLAENFFNAHPSLGINFRENVLILNKTPLHTPRTLDLKKIAACDKSVSNLIAESQKEMVSILKSFYAALAPIKIWVVGYSEMKKGGVFENYTRTLFETLPRGDIYLYRHFSMNQFAVDFNRKKVEFDKSTDSKTLDAIGAFYRERTLGQI